MRRKLAGVKGNASGVTAVEFAVVLPGLLTLICGTIEAGHMILARTVLEGAVTEAARKATASLETDEATRTQIMRNSIISSMSQFAPATNQQLTITTKVYRDFSTAYPEVFTDLNKNGKYDFGEPYVDRNQNGKWDDETPLPGETLGGPGDVVSYTATFPKQVLFGFLSGVFGTNGAIPLKATTVVRNEATVRKSSS